MAKSGAAGGTPLTLKFIQGINNVAQKVKPISDLTRGWRPHAHALAHPVPAVTRDDLGTGMRS